MMRRDTFGEALRRFNRAVPFRRFTVELLNGERLIGYHPEAIVPDGGGDLILYTEPDDTRQFFDASSVARVVSVVIPPDAH